MAITKQPTLAEFQQWAKDCRPAAKAVLMARVFAEMERERVDAYVRPIFDRYQFQYSQSVELRSGRVGVIDSPKDLYLCDDEPGLKAYYQDCDEAHRQHGFRGPEGHCPALRAEHLLCVTERALMDLARPLFDIDPDHVYGDQRAKYVELLIGGCFAKVG
jgi:hypothetical protein